MKTIIVIVLALLMTVPSFAGQTREAELAGTWYTVSSAQLDRELDGYLAAASVEKIDGDTLVLISPHAGLQYSGPVAAYGFKALEGRPVKTVIVIGFSHRSSFNCVAVYANGSWRTPLGDIAIDEELAAALIAKDPRIQARPELFGGEENSLELEIPFIQKVFKGARIVPVEFGTQDYSDALILGRALASVIGSRGDVLIVASTDMSHYHPYDEANAIDGRTTKIIEGLDPKELYDQSRLGLCELCGFMPVTSAMIAAGELGFNRVKVLRRASSGDTSGDKTGVVGYISAAIYKQTIDQRPQTKDQKTGDGAMLNQNQRKRLLEIARESLKSFVRDQKRKGFKEPDPVLSEPMGAFVTLHEAGVLRGCIGNMVGRGPLYQTVADMAIEAATGDPRFPPLSASEIEKIDIEISVLSPLKRAAGHEEIRIPGHGVLVRRGFASGVYLPQVATETGWSKDEFLASLCGQKAGMSPDAWKDPSTELYTFTAEVFGEKDFK